MGKNRFRYGLALGPYKNFEARSDNVFAENDATPDVSLGTLFYTNNTSNTVITHFDLGEEGQLITVIFIDNSTTVANAGRLYLYGSGALKGSNNSITLINHNSAWHEVSRSVNQNDVTTITLATGASSANVDYTKFAILMPTSAGIQTKVSALSGGDVGQIVTVISGTGGLVANSASVIMITGGNIVLGATNALAIQTNQTVQFVKHDSARWVILRAPTAG